MSSRRHSERTGPAKPESADRDAPERDPSDELDLERDLPTTPEDVEVLRRLRNRPITPEQYAQLLRAAGDASYEELLRRRGPRGEPFEL